MRGAGGWSVARRGGAASLAVAALALAGCLQPEVVRVVDGRAIQGDFVDEEAYSAYLRGGIAEREGRLDDAARLYAVAAAESGDPAAHARRGAVLCALGRRDAAREAFDEGLDEDPAAAIVHRERARCALAEGALVEAIAAAERAVALDPRDREAIAVLHDALLRGGRGAEARAFADEAAALGHPLPGDPRAAAAFAGAARRVDASAARPGHDLLPSLRAQRPSISDVDEALARGDLDSAARRATAAGVSRADLAARALAHGHRAWAAVIAERVLAADPGDATAWCVAVAARAPDGDPGAAAAVQPSGSPSPLAALLLGEVLLRRGGDDAALAWVAPAALERPREDPLEERVRARLEQAIHER